MRILDKDGWPIQLGSNGAGHIIVDQDRFDSVHRVLLTRKQLKAIGKFLRECRRKRGKL